MSYPQHQCQEVKWVFNHPLRKKRFALILVHFDIAERSATNTVQGFYDSLQEAKGEANQKFAEFNPGIAMIQDVEGGKLLRACNWMHDSLIWEEYKPGESSKERAFNG
jgi:hypothetical protein